MLTVRTGRINSKRQDVLDITIKSGKKIFAPTWNMVWDYKKGRITKAEYTRQYYELMRKSYKEHRSEWEALLSQESVTLTCYCRAGEFCHRILLAKILEELGAEYLGE